MLSKKDLEHLAELARIELKEGAAGGEPRHGREEQKLQKDLGAILDYFEELKSVDTENIQPMTGGTELKSVVREDVISPKSKAKSQNGVEAFPETKNGYLKVPPVF